MAIDWQVVLIALAAIFLRIIAMRADPEIVPVAKEGSSERSISGTGN